MFSIVSGKTCDVYKPCSKTCSGVFKVSLEKRVFQCFFQLHPNMFLLKHIVFIRKTHQSYYKTLAYLRENTKRLYGTCLLQIRKTL